MILSRGLMQFLIPAQQWCASLVSHRSLLRTAFSLPKRHQYTSTQIGMGASLLDSPTTKVEISRNRLLKRVASTLIIGRVFLGRAIGSGQK